MARPEGGHSAGFRLTRTDLPLSEATRGESVEIALSCTLSGTHCPFSMSTIRRKSSMRKRNCTFLHCRRYRVLRHIRRLRWSSKFSSSLKWEAPCLTSTFHSQWWLDIAGVEVETWILKKSEVRAHVMARKLRSAGFTPQKSELSSHQMSPGGVVSHSSSWTAAAYEPHEVFLPRLFRLRQFGRRFRSTHRPVPCEVDPLLYGSAGCRSRGVESRYSHHHYLGLYSLHWC